MGCVRLRLGTPHCVMWGPLITRRRRHSASLRRLVHPDRINYKDLSRQTYLSRDEELRRSLCNPTPRQVGDLRGHLDARARLLPAVTNSESAKRDPDSKDYPRAHIQVLPAAPVDSGVGGGSSPLARYCSYRSNRACIHNIQGK